LVSINERTQQEALRKFYEMQEKKEKIENKLKRIQILRRFSIIVNPLICVGFVAVFWVAGMIQVNREV
jgi:hypothetical protein